HFITIIRRNPAMKAIFRLAAALIIVALASSSCSKSKPDERQAALDPRPLLSIMAPLHFPNPPDPKIVGEIEQLTGTRLAIEWIRDEIYADKMNTALMTDSLKKATFVKYTDYILMK